MTEYILAFLDKWQIGLAGVVVTAAGFLRARHQDDVPMFSYIRSHIGYYALVICLVVIVIQIGMWVDLREEFDAFKLKSMHQVVVAKCELVSRNLSAFCEGNGVHQARENGQRFDEDILSAYRTELHTDVAGMCRQLERDGIDIEWVGAPCYQVSSVIQIGKIDMGLQIACAEFEDVDVQELPEGFK